MERLQNIELAAIWQFFWKQPWSFKFISLYLFFEYVRPQSIYEPLSGLPWPTWCLAGALGTCVLEGRTLKRFSSADLWLVLYLVVVLLSSRFAWDPSLAYPMLYFFFSWVAVYFLITRLVDNEAKYFFYIGLFLLFSLKMSQHATRSLIGRGFAFDGWGASGAPGFFRNSGEMAIQMCIFLPLSYYFLRVVGPRLKTLTRQWKYWIVLALPVTAVLSIIASTSRGGQIGAAAVVLWMVLHSPKRVRMLTIGAVACVAGWLMLPAQQKARFTEMGDDDTSQARLIMWEDALEVTRDHPVLGIGYENWVEYYRAHYPHRDNFQVVHNIFLQASTELGLIGLGVFVVMIFWTLRMNAVTRRRMRSVPDGRFFYFISMGLDAGLIGFLVAGSFVTVLYYPYFWINYALTAALYTLSKDKLDAARRAHRAVVLAGSTPPAPPGRPSHAAAIRPAPG